MQWDTLDDIHGWQPRYVAGEDMGVYVFVCVADGEVPTPQNTIKDWIGTHPYAAHVWHRFRTSIVPFATHTHTHTCASLAV